MFGQGLRQLLALWTWWMPPPAQPDPSGWELRLRVDSPLPLIAREDLDHVGVTVALVNRSRIPIMTVPLESARRSWDLKVDILNSQGKPVPTGWGRRLRDDPVEIFRELKPGQYLLSPFSMREFGHQSARQPDVQRVEASLQFAKGLIRSNSAKFPIVEPDPASILDSIVVPIEGVRSTWLPERRPTVVIQRIKLGERTWLFFRRRDSAEDGGQVSGSYRIAELPRSVTSIKVSGAHGEKNPLTIDVIFRSGTIRKYVVNSLSGRPWTTEEETLRQLRIKDKK